MVIEHELLFAEGGKHGSFMIEIDNAVVDKNLDENFLKKLGNLNL
jgi:hypothetical protein